MDVVRAPREDAFERLYAEHAQALFGFLRYRTGNTAVAEDLLADTCERALRARRRFDPRKGSAKTWFYAIALNCLSDHVRKRASEGRALERVVTGAGLELREEIDEGAEEQFEDIAEHDLLNRSMAELSSEERETISLRYGADLSVPEIAKLTGEPLTTIESRVYRSLRKLRESMDL